LPDWRNLGVILRILLLVNLLAMLTAAVPAEELGQWWNGIGAMAVWVEFPLMLTLLLLYGIKPIIGGWSPWAGWLVVLAVIWVAASGWYFLLDRGGGEEALRWLGWSAMAWGATLAYFQYRSARYSPAISEARLLALTARIRPHFFFNSLNGVLGMIRSDPKRAEVALEELADLFRVLMRDNRELVTLQEEIELCHRYLGLEQLRLGERLNVEWRDAGCPGDALVPPLMLQPLLENAVYHGIEPARDAGRIDVLLRRTGQELFIEVVNDLPPARESSDPPAHGNRIALDNLRERLMLFFDLEASLTISERDGRFRVRLRLPYRTAKR
jgi:two-component system, LytTR family, sensor histidine kinase AlgZ